MKCFYCNQPGEIVEPFSNVIDCNICPQGLTIDVRTAFNNDMTVSYIFVNLLHKKLQLIIEPNKNVTSIVDSNREKSNILINVIPTDLMSFIQKIDTYILFS